MSLLDLKLLRDLRALRTQALAVALVMACGLTMMIMTRSLIHSLETARTRYYESNRFAQLFAELKRAPLPVSEEIAHLPGVASVQASIAEQVTLDIPGLLEPARAEINSVPDWQQPELNRLYLRSGHLLTIDSRNEILVGEAFADAHRLKPGDKLSAILNGRKLPLTIAGIVLSPEFIFEAPSGAALPDNRTFGVFWMRYEEIAEAYSLYGAFNKIVVLLSPGASEKSVIAAIDGLLAPYGGIGAIGRSDHPSHIRLSDEIRVLNILSFAFPIVFLGVASFMTNAVMSRQIRLQREQIAVLKAFGFSNAQIGWHYFKFSFAIVGFGTGLGVLGGIILGHRLVEMYHLFFRFPHLDFLLSWETVFAAAGASSLATSIGISTVVLRAVQLPPAQAMRPEAPSSYRPAWIERLPWTRRFSTSLRMAFRSLERKPWPALLTITALALATAILVVPNAFRDGVRHVLDFQWDTILRETVSVRLIEPGPARALHDFAQLPGVIYAEPTRAVPVQLQAGQRTRRLALIGVPANAELTRTLDRDEHPKSLPRSGLVLSRKLAEVLGVKRGDLVRLHVLTEKCPTVLIPVTDLAEDFSGIIAYMDLAALNQLMETGDLIDGARLTVAKAAWPQFLSSIKATPRTSGVVIKEAMRNSFRETTAQSIGLIQTIYLFFATVVAFGIAYNSARISLSERQRELATLRVLGFTQLEVGGVLVAELIILTLIALPIGLGLGAFLSKEILLSVNTETVRLPLVLLRSNFAYATIVVALATAISLLLACRRLSQLDLVGVLKAQD